MIGAAVGAALVLTVQNLAGVVNLPSIILGINNNNNSPSAGVNDIKNKRAGVQILTTSIDKSINLHSTNNNNNNPQGYFFRLSKLASSEIPHSTQQHDDIRQQ
jgi:hypothetical protein